MYLKTIIIIYFIVFPSLCQINYNLIYLLKCKYYKSELQWSMQ